MSSYNNKPYQQAYGNPGFFTAAPTGSVSDPFGKSMTLNPEQSQRYSRRILVNTKHIKKDSDGVYHADIRPAKGVVAVKLAYASIPRSVTVRVAQLVLYSIPIRQLNGPNDTLSELYQKYCRQQLLNKDTSHYPFFTPGVHSTGSSSNDASIRINRGLDFDFRKGTASGIWIENVDRTTSIPYHYDPDYNNMRVDIDTLTVQIPEEVGIAELGNAFKNALQNHTGVEGDKKNSMWQYFGIGVTDTGFSVEMDHDKYNPFSTFAAFLPAHESSAIASQLNAATGTSTPSASGAGLEEARTGRDTYIALTTPVSIYLDKSRDAFIEYQVIEGSANAPTDVTGAQTQMTRVRSAATTSDEDFEFVVSIPTDISSTIYSISFPNDVKLENIKKVETTRIIEAEVTNIGTDGTTYIVQYYNGTSDDLTAAAATAAAATPATTLKVTAPDSTIVEDTTTGVPFNSANGNQLVVGGSGFTGTIPVGSRLLIEAGKQRVSLSQIQKSFQRSRDIRLGLRWPGRSEDEDFTIHGNYEYSSTTDMQTITGLGANDSNPAPDLSTYNSVMTETELEDTYVPSAGNGIEAQMLPIHKINDADQSDEMMFCGHFMNVTEPSTLLAFNGRSSDFIANMLTPTAVNMNTLYTHPPTDANLGGNLKYFENGLGYETSVVHKATKYVMPAFPKRDGKTYNVATGPVEGLPNVMPLVARILNTNLKKDGNDTIATAFFACKDDSDTVSNYANHDFSQAVYFESKSLTQSDTSSNDVKCKNSIVITIGSERYVVKKAYYISVLKNQTMYTLDMSCQNGGALLYPLACVDPAEPNHRNMTQAAISFYETNAPTNDEIRPTAQSKYFTWCFELDREVLLPTGLSAQAVPYRNEVVRRNPSNPEDLSTIPSPPSVSARVFKGVSDSTAMFCPSSFYRNTGRIAVSKFQDAPHRFYVRTTGAALADKQQPVLCLHGIGNIEYPVNNSEHMGYSDSFALLGTDNVDQKKPLTPCVPSYVAFKSPLNLHRLSFSFVTIDGDEYVLKQNATLMFDVFAEND
jgi:hypothetical protein